MFLYIVYADIRKGSMGVRKHLVIKETPTRYKVDGKQVFNKSDLDKLNVSGESLSFFTMEDKLDLAIDIIKSEVDSRILILQDMFKRLDSITEETIRNIKNMKVEEPVLQEPVHITADMV